MKLRSNAATISQDSPATQAITVINTSSPLLRLPQELKNFIYTLILGGQTIHVEASPSTSKTRPYHLYRCRSTSTSASAQKKFDTAIETPGDFLNPHRHCVPPAMFRWSTRWRKLQMLPRPMGLTPALLLACRQIYHEAKHVLSTANTFSFQDPELLGQFMRHCDSTGRRHIGMRHLILHMGIFRTEDEVAWNQALQGVSRTLRSLRSVDVSIEQMLWNRTIYQARSRRFKPSVTDEKKKKGNTFLKAVSGLGKLPLLKDMTLVVDDLYKGNDMRESGDRYVWTQGQKQIWAWGLISSILGRLHVLDD